MVAYNLMISFREADVGAKKGNGDASKLKAALVELGWTVFLSEEDIPPGVDWPRVIGETISEAKAIVVLCTQTYGDSHACADEISLAQQKGKPLFLVLHSGDWPPRNCKLALASYNYIMWEGADDTAQKLHYSLASFFKLSDLKNIKPRDVDAFNLEILEANRAASAQAHGPHLEALRREHNPAKLVAAVVAAMAQQAGDAEASEAGCKAITIICENLDDDNLRLAAGKAGAIEAVVAALRGHGAHAGVQEAGCRALEILKGADALMGKV